MFIERNEQVKFKTVSGVKEPKTGWSRPVKELTVKHAFEIDREQGLEVRPWGLKRNDLAGICN